ncbi:MAG: RNA polymerase sigma factor [Actinobacteria bacterium]|nr:MAG: RNA polymerase sigma factor [Actinomycetota bacterium]
MCQASHHDESGYVFTFDEFPSVLAAARQNAEWAWTALYRAYAPDVLRYLRARGADDAEDLLGEVFVQVVRGVPGFEGDAAAFRSWVFMIAHNRLVDAWRRGARQMVDYVPDELLLSVTDDGRTEDEVERGLGEERVRVLLDRLAPDQRDVLTLRIIADLSIEQVAAVLGKTPGAVKSLQHRGLERMRKGLSRKGVSL